MQCSAGQGRAAWCAHCGDEGGGEGRGEGVVGEDSHCREAVPYMCVGHYVVTPVSRRHKVNTVFSMYIGNGPHMGPLPSYQIPLVGGRRPLDSIVSIGRRSARALSPAPY